MSFASDIIGTHYRYPDYYLVGREKIREYAAAVQCRGSDHSMRRRPGPPAIPTSSRR